MGELARESYPVLKLQSGANLLVSAKYNDSTGSRAVGVRLAASKSDVGDMELELTGPEARTVAFWVCDILERNGL